MSNRPGAMQHRWTTAVLVFVNLLALFGLGVFLVARFAPSKTPPADPRAGERLAELTRRFAAAEQREDDLRRRIAAADDDVAKLKGDLAKALDAEREVANALRDIRLGAALDRDELDKRTAEHAKATGELQTAAEFRTRVRRFEERELTEVIDETEVHAKDPLPTLTGLMEERGASGALTILTERYKLLVMLARAHGTRGMLRAVLGVPHESDSDAAFEATRKANRVAKDRDTAEAVAKFHDDIAGEYRVEAAYRENGGGQAVEGCSGPALLAGNTFCLTVEEWGTSLHFKVCPTEKPGQVDLLFVGNDFNLRGQRLPALLERVDDGLRVRVGKADAARPTEWQPQKGLYCFTLKKADAKTQPAPREPAARKEAAERFLAELDGEYAVKYLKDFDTLGFRVDGTTTLKGGRFSLIATLSDPRDSDPVKLTLRHALATDTKTPGEMTMVLTVAGEVRGQKLNLAETHKGVVERDGDSVLIAAAPGDPRPTSTEPSDKVRVLQLTRKK